MTIRRILPAAALLLAAPLLAGCQAFGINSEYDAQYPDLPAAQESWDAMKIPMLVPDDARGIRIAYNTVDEGQVMAFTSEGGLTADYCEESDLDTAPMLQPGWWPEELADAGWVCGDWSVVTDGDRYLVWD